MELTSTAFNHNENIPSKYTCKGKDINPPLEIKEIPEGAKSLVLIVDDPDAPHKIWDHWILFNINPHIQYIKEDMAPGVQGLNSWNKNKYGGPCPPSGTHRYFFKLYALDCKLELDETATKEYLIEEMQGHILEQTE